MILPEVLTLASLTIASAFCSSSEVAFFSLPLSRLKSFYSDSNRKKRECARLMQQATGLLVTIFMLNTIVNILLQNAASALFDHIGGGWALKVGLPLFIVLVFGELIPKYFGLKYNELLAQTYVQTISCLHYLVGPFRVAITWISSTLSRLSFFYLKAEAPLTNEELQHILESSEGKGLLTREERETVLGVLALEHKQVRDVMIPRNKMALYDIEESLSKLSYLFSAYNCSEIPVIQTPQEKVLGIISASDLFAKRLSISSQKDLKSIITQPFFVPETMSAKALLHQFAEQKSTSALVIDEYSQMTGIISELDLIKQIAKTKSQTSPLQVNYKRVSPDTIIASGSLSLDEVNLLFGTKLESIYHVVTIGGYLTEKLGMIPKNQMTYEHEEQDYKLFFRILAADPTKVNTVYIQFSGKITDKKQQESKV